MEVDKSREHSRIDESKDDFEDTLLKLNDTLARSEKNLAAEERWLDGIVAGGDATRDTVNSTVGSGGVEDVQEYFVNNIEGDYMIWLKAELVEVGVEAEMIAKMETGAEIIEESMVGLESLVEDSNHHGRVHTPLLGTSTITEKGVEKGLVIGLHSAVDDRRPVETIIAKEKQDNIKYVSEVGQLPRWSFSGYKASCSTWIDPSEIMRGRGRDTHRRYEKGDGIIHRQEGEWAGDRKEILLSRGQETGPDLKSGGGGGNSNPVGGMVRKFVSQYEERIKIEIKRKTEKCLARGQENTNIHSYFNVFGPFCKKYDESSPVKTVDVGKFGRFLSPASKRKMNGMERGSQGELQNVSARICDIGQDEVLPVTKKLRTYGR